MRTVLPRAFFVVAGLLAVVGVSAADLGSNGLAEARSQASNSLAAFRSLITPTNYKLMGFSSSNEIATATNGEPLAIYAIPLSVLRNYQQQDEISSLVRPTSRALVPIFVGNKLRSSTTVRRDARGWSTANWGQPQLIRDVMAAYKVVPASSLPAGSTPFVLEVPVFNLWFVGYTNLQNKIVLHSTATLQLGPVTVNRNEVISTNALYRLATMAQGVLGQSN